MKSFGLRVDGNSPKEFSDFLAAELAYSIAGMLVLREPAEVALAHQR